MEAKIPQHSGPANHCCNYQHFCKPATHKQGVVHPFSSIAVETLGMLNQSYRVGGACPNFVEKTIVDVSETMKFENIFPLKVSPI